MRKIIFLLALTVLLNLGGARTGICAELKVVVDFDNAVDSRNFIQGEPVVISLLVSNTRAMNDRYYNIASGKEEKKVSNLTVGTADTPWINFINFTLSDSQGKVMPVKFYANPVKENEVALGADNFAENYFFITGEDSAKLSPDSYSLKAILDANLSNSLELKMVSRPKELDRPGQVDSLLKNGRYYLLLGNFSKAEEYANNILAIDSHSLKALNLLGDAQDGLGRFEEALKTFNRAVDEFFAQYPPPEKDSPNYRPPELFMEKINKLKQKLIPR